MGFPKQESWSGLSCPLPGDLLDPGIELTSLMSPALAGGFYTTSATREAYIYIHTYMLEEEMATHSSILSRKIPWTEEPGGLQSMGVAKSWT